jgi:hypothetical protein
MNEQYTFNILLLILFALFIQTVELITASYSGNGTLFVCMYDNIMSFIASLFTFTEMAKL